MLLFIKAAELRSMSAAGRASGKPKATISRAISRLETALNARLLERSSRHVVVTEAGAAFLVYCRRMAEELAVAEAAVAELQSSARGLLRVAAPMTFGSAALAPVLSSLLLRYPELDVELHLTDSMLNPIEDEFDAIIQPGPLPNSSLVSRELGRIDYGIYVSPMYSASHPEISTPEDVAAHRVIDSFGGEKHKIWEFEREGRLVKVQVRPRLDVNDSVVRRDAAIAGVGIAMAPAWICRRALAERTLERPLSGWSVRRTVPVFALWPSRKHVPPRLRLLLDSLAEAIPRTLSG